MSVISSSSSSTNNKVKNPNKLFYSMANLEGTYEDLANWFSELLVSGAKEKVTTQDIVSFLDTKSRVPPGILKNKKKPVHVSRPQCIAICNGSKVQCKNENHGDSEFCKTHQRCPPKLTINDPRPEIKTKRKYVRKTNNNKEEVVEPTAAAPTTEPTEEPTEEVESDDELSEVESCDTESGDEESDDESEAESCDTESGDEESSDEEESSEDDE